MLSILLVCWHYLLCGLLLWGCWQWRKAGKHALAVLCVFCMAVAAVVGFFLVYSGPFLESGKNFYHYVTVYGIVTLPIFLFPLGGAAMLLFWKRIK